ncbi:uncharacterized protein LOC143042595 isoform X2 [Mytilus galloprovincialis]|uniref:uncharacterized protein LOC143042595 isoform X2 n=1 Tax=Mytilus galloprovincialis TaxID=29158 RepID=UPI003F7C8375
MEKNQGKLKHTLNEDDNSEVYHIYDNQQDDPMYSMKLKLLSECQKLVGNDRQGRPPLNIAIIGQTGCGKSSFLNTVFASLNTDCWRDIARSGFFKIEGPQLHCTERFRSFSKKDYYRAKNDKGVLMPTFLDMTGFPDENTKTVLDLLEIIFSGRINENQKLADIEEGFKSISSEAVTYYNKEVSHLPVDRIIVVSTLDPDSPLPRYLLSAISEAAKKVRDIPTFGVLTGRDKYNPFSNKAVSNKLTKFREVLGITKNRFACITNYCENSDPDTKYLTTTIPQFDVPVLQFLKQVFTTSPEEFSRKTIGKRPWYCQVTDESEQKELRDKLLERCKELVGISGKDKNPLTIAVIGTPGGGKSAFLNTIFAALSNERWIEHAKCTDTRRGGRQITQRLKRFLMNDYYSTEDDCLMPTFLDMAGFENDDSLLTKEMLNIVLSGKFEDGEKLSNMVLFGKEKGVNALKEKYSKKKSENVNRLIVVCSADPDLTLPNALFKSIIDVTSRDRDITVYGVFTQTDKYSSDDPKVVEKERQFLTELHISETRFARIKNYCPDVDPSMNYRYTTIPSLDIPVLRFLDMVFEHESTDFVEDTSPELHPLLKLNPVEIAMFVGFIVVLIGMFIFWL